MAKSSQAFRTIREVADWLGVAAHVLRFWESKFAQIKPVKRAGGRRYYRPSDMELIGGIKVLLHDQGYTIRGVQRLIRRQGLEAVTQHSPPLDSVLAADDAPQDDVSVWENDAAESQAVETPAEPSLFEAMDAEEPFDDVAIEDAASAATEEDEPITAETPEPEAEVEAPAQDAERDSRSTNPFEDLARLAKDAKPPLDTDAQEAAAQAMEQLNALLARMQQDVTR